MADLIDEQVDIINKHITSVREPRKTLDALKKLLAIQKKLLKDHSEIFENMGNTDARGCLRTSLEAPVDATNYALEIVEGDYDEYGDNVPGGVAWHDKQNDKALALIIKKHGFEAFLDPRVLEAMEKFVFKTRFLVKTHTLLKGVRFIPNNPSNITVNFYSKTIEVKLPHEVEALDENLMSEIITHIVPLMTWFVSTCKVKSRVTVYGYNGSYSSKVILENTDDGMIWRTEVTPHSPQFKEMYPKNSTFESFGDLVTELVKANEKIKIASR